MSLATPFVDSSEEESELSDGRLSPVTLAESEADAVVTVSEAARDVSSQAPAAQAMSPRAYQLEMLQRSLEGNVIVVMDTGSGKTQVAVMRIKIELDNGSPDKIIWFLAPTVSLCEQQYQVISNQIVSVRVKLLTGNDNVETWSESTWEAALDGTRIIITTYQVLLDALSNAFVSMDQLSLIIFDEAHNCVEKHPGSKLMKTFYHDRRGRGGSLPSVLGLTATPSFRSTFKGMEDLEKTLDASCVTPTLHREALLSHVKRPTVCKAVFTASSQLQLTPSMQSLQDSFAELDINQDPFILKLLAEPNDKNRRALEKVLRKQDTYSRDQIKRLCIRCDKVLEQLGPWAADAYLWKAFKQYQNSDEMDDISEHLYVAERRYVAAILDCVSLECPPSRPQSLDDISDKVHVLMQQLVSAEGSVVGIIFAKERVTVTMLCEFLESCPAITKRYRIGTMLGRSTNPSRNRCLFEFPGETEQDGLEAFRAGTVNLLVGTSVLEEGIDVPACNLVVCFDLPDNYKALVQRRGRARMHGSKLILLTEASTDISHMVEALERDANQALEDRQKEMDSLEELEPDGEDYFRVPETGALLDYDNAKGRLSHLCAVLTRGEYIDSRPDYILDRNDDTIPTQWRATVLLPPLVPVELRRIQGHSTWLSRKNATKDAAFEAYLALYRAGLVDEHLLPLRLNVIPPVEKRVAKVDVEQSFSPWYQVAEAWESRCQNWLYPLIFEDENHVRSHYEILFPVQLEHFHPMKLFLSFGASCRVQFGEAKPVSADRAETLADDTCTLLTAAFSHRWRVEDKPQVARFIVPGERLSREQIGSARFDAENEKHTSGLYLIRDAQGTPFRYLGLVSTKPPIELVRRPFPEYELAPAKVPYVVLDRLTKRMDLLKRLESDAEGEVGDTKPYPWILPLANAMVDEIPMRHVHFGLMIPSIVHELEVLVTTKLLAMTEQLQPVALTNLSLVREARSTRSARGPVNYERLEFLGDSILKYCTSVQMAADSKALQLPSPWKYRG
ncbi:hypothetical protein CDD80_4653 [Ophiocordyceps camponoti-rufipedis]|uniref:Dicer-like protein 2 n=1 Tax=Ophiocordyceps camponoti-rufipedis TaxID=2004952 RepID=A0A2C5YXC2_9HYPO|nr:hypothetical protein CDD80_4653 [Ophiocordyceps camponoti-rufipedis]